MKTKFKIVVIVILSVLFQACHSKDVNIDENFYNVLSDYQKKNPLPSKESTSETFFQISKNLKYVYEAAFYKNGFLYITLNPNGINVEEKSFGIYQDSNLKPTYIIDDDKAGREFIKKYIQKDLQKYTSTEANMIDVVYPTFVYRIKGDKLIFLESIRGNVRK